VDVRATREPWRVNRVFELVLADLRQHPLALGAVAEDDRAQLGKALARQRHRRHDRGHPFLRDVAAEEHDHRLGRLRRLGLDVAQSLEKGDLAVVAQRTEPLRVQT
jgi:hypothetical protein